MGGDVAVDEDGSPYDSRYKKKDEHHNPRRF